MRPDDPLFFKACVVVGLGAMALVIALIGRSEVPVYERNLWHAVGKR